MLTFEQIDINGNDINEKRINRIPYDLPMLKLIGSTTKYNVSNICLYK